MVMPLIPPLHIHFDQRVHHLNGQKAMEFLRWRKGKRKVKDMQEATWGV